MKKKKIRKTLTVVDGGSTRKEFIDSKWSILPSGVKIVSKNTTYFVPNHVIAHVEEIREVIDTETEKKIKSILKQTI